MYIYTYMRTKEQSQHFEMGNVKVLLCDIFSSVRVILNSFMRKVIIAASRCVSRAEDWNKEEKYVEQCI